MSWIFRRDPWSIYFHRYPVWFYVVQVLYFIVVLCLAAYVGSQQHKEQPPPSPLPAWYTQQEADALGGALRLGWLGFGVAAAGVLFGLSRVGAGRRLVTVLTILGFLATFVLGAIGGFGSLQKQPGYVTQPFYYAALWFMLLAGALHVGGLVYWDGGQRKDWLARRKTRKRRFKAFAAPPLDAGGDGN